MQLEVHCKNCGIRFFLGAFIDEKSGVENTLKEHVLNHLVIFVDCPCGQTVKARER